MIRWYAMAEELRDREEAATLVEYTFVMILVAASCFAAVSSFGSALGSLFTRVVNSFPK